MVSAVLEELAHSFPLKSQVTGRCNSTITFKVLSSGKRKCNTSKGKYMCQESKSWQDIKTWLKYSSVTGNPSHAMK